MVVAGCGGSDDEAPAEADPGVPSSIEVNIADFLFEPEAVTIATGGTVTWLNDDSAAHTATEGSDPPIFDTGTLQTGDEDTVTFDKPGTYDYICLLHPFMNGSVTVE